jgi:glycosyltransferase involved in cell wall biosynthesis|tara:strand:+ start:731 stop:1414 length:684 start_codon:yes stop_codon:yes gene_type:complete
MSRGDIVVTMDADLQDDPHEIKNLLAKIEEGWDVVSGWKEDRKDPYTKRIPSKIFNFIVRKVSNLNIHDFNCGLKAYRSKVTKTLNIYGGLHRFIPYLAVSNGFSVTEVAVNHRSRQFGESKYGGSRMFKGFFDFLSVVFITKYSKRPLHIFGFIGFLLFLSGIIINIYLTVSWFYGQPLANRPLLFLGILLIILGIQIFSMGFIAELLVNYLSKKNKTIEDVIKKD